MIEETRAKFDKLAHVDEEGWTRSSHHFGFMLRQLPPHLREALDVGCGSGAFTCELAQCSDHVLGLDLSPEVIQVATKRSQSMPNVTYEVADVHTYDLGTDRYDAISSVVALHLMAREELLNRFKAALAPGGTLIILEIYRRHGLLDRLLQVASLPLEKAIRLANTGRLVRAPEVRAAWRGSGLEANVLSMAEARRLTDLLPGAIISRRLYRRFSLVWKKPA